MTKHIEIHSRAAYYKEGDEDSEETFLNIKCDDDKCEVTGDEETLAKLRDALGVSSGETPSLDKE